MGKSKPRHRYPVRSGVSNDPASQSGYISSSPALPVVSVIMPARNAAAVLARAIRSVQAQTLESWELWVVDDASSDNTCALVEEMARHEPRIHLLCQSAHSGAAQARNRAIRKARARYIAFLDGDDEWLPEKLARQVAFMQARGSAFSYTGFWRAGPKGRREVRVPGRITYEGLLRGNVIGCLTAMYDRDALGTVEMPGLRLRQDYGLWLKLLRRCSHAEGLQEPLAIYHQQAKSLSSNRLRAAGATWQLYRQAEGLSRAKALYCLASHLVRRLRRG